MVKGCYWVIRECDVIYEQYLLEEIVNKSKLEHIAPIGINVLATAPPGVISKLYQFLLSLVTLK